MSTIFFSHWRRLDPYAGGYWRQELLNGRSALLPLVEKHGFYRRFVKAQTDPLDFLIQLQQSIDRPIFIVPQLMFFSKSPASSTVRLRDLVFGTEQKPGLMRRLFILLRRPGKVFVEISQPLNLQEFISGTETAGSNPEYKALRLRRQLLLQHNRHRQSITGPVVKSHEEIKESILASDRPAPVHGQPCGKQKRVHPYHSQTSRRVSRRNRRKVQSFFRQLPVRRCQMAVQHHV